MDRIKIAEREPAGYKALLGLEAYLRTTSLSKTHQELIKIRASQINGCSFCLDMHTREALGYGETAQRIFLLSAWREAGLFSEEERVILALTEEITLISARGLTDETYNKALQLFGEAYLAQLILAVVNINALNRIGVSTRLPIPRR